MALLVAVTLGEATTPPADVASSIKTNLNGGNFDSAAIFGTGHTITGGTPAWCVVGAQHQVSAVSVGAGIRSDDDFRGTRVIRPTRELGITVLGPAGTNAAFGVGVEWHEVDRATG